MEKERRRQHVAPTLRRVNRMMKRNLEIHVEEEGIDEITMVHGWFLQYLYENQGKDIFQKDIEKQFGFCKSSITNTIQMMEKKRYLKREAVKQDARLKKVLLTEKGIKAQQAMKSLIDQLDERTLEGITDEELESFFDVMAKIEANLIQQKEEKQQGKE